MLTFNEFLQESRASDIKTAVGHLSSLYEHIGAIYTCSELSNWHTTVSNVYVTISKLLDRNSIRITDFVIDDITSNFDNVIDIINKKISKYGVSADIDKDSFILFVRGLLDAKPTTGQIVKDYVESNLDIRCQDLSTKKNKRSKR